MSDIAVAKNLRAAGFSQEQAEVLAESISNGIAGGAATKLDIAGLKMELRADIAKLDNKCTKLETKFSAMFALQVLILGILLAEFIKPLF